MSVGCVVTKIVDFVLCLLSVDINKRTTEKALNKIKISHGSGVDNIASYFPNVAFPTISDSLYDVFNLSWSFP